MSEQKETRNQKPETRKKKLVSGDSEHSSPAPVADAAGIPRRDAPGNAPPPVRRARSKQGVPTETRNQPPETRKKKLVSRDQEAASPAPAAVAAGIPRSDDAAVSAATVPPSVQRARTIQDLPSETRKQTPDIRKKKQVTRKVGAASPTPAADAAGISPIPAITSEFPNDLSTAPDEKETSMKKSSKRPVRPAPRRSPTPVTTKPAVPSATSTTPLFAPLASPAPALTGRTADGDRRPAMVSRLSDDDLHYFNEGRHHHLHEKLGSHLLPGGEGAQFAVWAPEAKQVSVIGEFNAWDKTAAPLELRGTSGIWEGVVGGVAPGSRYKYHIVSKHRGYVVDKADPFAWQQETAPKTASIVSNNDYEWNDSKWIEERKKRNHLKSPMTIYEIHLGSWRRVSEEGGRSLTYREIAPLLADYVKRVGFTHVEFLPLMEHPFFGSWGYQTTGYFAPTGRYGSPQDLMYLIDHLHQNGIGVIFDWVPSHFPGDEHGLAYFDGTYLFEHADPRKGFHPDWSSWIFNYGRPEVRSFLISSAIYWLDKFHVDVLRVDAVASMLYLDYSRKAGEWIPNEHGGRENLEAIFFLRQLNDEIGRLFPEVPVIAEESTAWPMVSRPTHVGGLGFEMKWDMGWMHDTLAYMALDSIHRKYQQNKLTFRLMYAYTENFVLPLSHDEVVHGKGSLLMKMPGDEWRKFANLRLLYAYMYAQPGKKLIFMGGEIGQIREWNHDGSLDWHLLERPAHASLHRWVEDLNRVYRENPAFFEKDTDPSGFEWIDCCDAEQSVVSLIRRGDSSKDLILGVFNFTPIPRYNYQVGVPEQGWWREILNSDADEYGGSGQGNLGRVESSPVGYHARPFSVSLTLPPLSALFFALEQSVAVETSGAEDIAGTEAFEDDDAA